MKRKILSVGLAVAMVATLLTGCGKKSTDTKTTAIDVKKMNFKTNQELTKDDITLTVWESKAGPDDFIKKAGEYFTELYPNIKIKYVPVESTDANSKIGLDGPGGKGPDLFACAHNNAGVMAASGSIAAIPDSEKDIIASSCTEQALQGATLNASDGSSTLYAFPVSVETYALFYNKALIKEDEVPKTMADLVTYIENFNNSGENAGKKPFLMDTSKAYYQVMFLSTPENHLYGKNGNDRTSTYMNTPEAVKQLGDYIALSKAINQKSDDMAFTNNDSKFSAGTLAMDISGAWNIKTFEENRVDFGITSIPALTGTNTPPTNFMGIRCMFVSNYSEHKPEAVAFGEFLMTKEMQQLRCEITSTMPARDDVLENINDDKIKEYMAGLSKQIKYSYPMPNMSEASLFWSAFDGAVANIWNGNVSTSEIQSELDKANKTAIGQ